MQRTTLQLFFALSFLSVTLFHGCGSSHAVAKSDVTHRKTNQPSVQQASTPKPMTLAEQLKVDQDGEGEYIAYWKLDDSHLVVEKKKDTYYNLYLYSLKDSKVTFDKYLIDSSEPITDLKKSPDQEGVMIFKRGEESVAFDYANLHYVVDNGDINSSASPLEQIRALIKSGNATYLCVGDSTRSNDPTYDNGHIVEMIRDALAPYGVKVKNISVTGILLKEVVEHRWDRLNMDTIVSEIAGDGSHTIVDIDLGINDYGEFTQKIDANMRKLVQTLLAKKPKVHILLEVPGRTYYDKEEMSNFFIRTYKRIAEDYHLAFLDIPTHAMPLDKLDLSWYRITNGRQDQTHLSMKGQKIVAHYIISQLLGE